MDFLLLVLTALAMYVPPPAILPELVVVHSYLWLITACFVLSFPAVLDQLFLPSLVKNPITLCILALIPAILISLLLCSDFYDARVFTWGFTKVCIYYLLLVALLKTPARYRLFLWFFLGIIVLVVGIGVLDYFGIAHNPEIRQFKQAVYDPETGQKVEEYFRLRSLNFFHDPSALCLLMTTGIWIALYGIARRGAWLERLAGLGVLGFFGWAFSLTGARGGFTALAAGSVAFFLTRFYRTKMLAIALTAVVLPLLFLTFAGRATQIDFQNEDRIDLWSGGIPFFIESPIFGIGADHYFDEIGSQAHNAFWEAYVDLGIFGGTFFVGIFYFAFWGLVRVGRAASANLVKQEQSGALLGGLFSRGQVCPSLSQTRNADPELRRFQPYLMAILVSHLAGLLTQPLTYTLPIYTVYGLIAAYLRLTWPLRSSPAIAFDRRQVKWLLATSFGFLVCFYILVRTMERLV